MKKIIVKKRQKGAEKIDNSAALKIGDKLLVTGPHYFEEVTVVSSREGKFKLSNNLVVDANLNPVNTFRVDFIVQRYSQENKDYLEARNSIPKLLDKIKESYVNWGKESTLVAFRRLKKIANF